MKETILTRWNDLSVAAKEILRRKEPLKLTEMPQALELLSQISRFTSQDTSQKNLIITYHVSDAIFIEMLLAIANPSLRVKSLLPHQTAIHALTDNNVIIAPFSLFLFADARHETFSISDFTTVILDQRISQEFISEYLMVQETHKALLDETNETTLLFTNFEVITSAIEVPATMPTVATPKATLETIKPKGEKISLGKSQENKKAPQKDSPKDQETAATEIAKKPAKQKTVTKAAVKTEAESTSETTNKTAQEVDPSAFIAVVARNVQRQYIRDYIREHNLQHVLIVTHNRQSARLLEKYLYRARIRSRVVHEKIDEETATSLFDRYNEGQFTAMILMHRVVEELAAKIEKCDAVIFLDFPTVYSEYANRLDFVQTHFKPQHFISISTENDRAWVQALLEEYPDLHLPLVEVDIKPPKKRQNQPKTTTDHEVTTPAQDNTTASAPAKENTPEEAATNDGTTDSQESSHQPRERRNNRRTQPRQNRQDQRPERQDRTERNNQRRENSNPRTNRRRQEQPAYQQQDQEFGDSQSDFFSANQDEIVNHNRLPFEAGSFEANIARENRRRGRDAFNTPGGIGQSTNGNFLQNITQGFNGNGNNNPQSQNRRSNNSNNNTRNRPRKNNRKK